MFADKIYVINLPGRLDRKNICEEQAKKYNLDLNYVDAIDGRDLDLDLLLKEGIIDKVFYDPHGTCCTMGTYGCSMSHIKAWQQAYDDGVEVSLFLEDDFFVSPFIDYNQMLSQKDYIMDVDWDVLFLGKHRRFVKGYDINSLMVKTTEDWLDTEVATRKEDTGLEYWGAHAYLVRRKTIKYLLDNYIPVNMGADVWLQYKSRGNDLKIYTFRETFIWQKTSLMLHNISVQKDLTIQEVNALNDSDTFHNLNRNGKLKWVQMPTFSSSLSKGEFMWEFNIKG